MKRYFSRRYLGGLLALLFVLLIPALAWAETRSLKIYYIHTREKAEIAFKKDGRYLDAGLKKLNHLLRDWRRNEPTNMDPRLFDLVWQVYKLSGSRDYIHVVSAYRSPSTNNMLRSRSANSGVAKNSQHTLGKALDFYLPDVNLAKLRGLGLRQEAGGVGYYPTSGSPFIHLDVGSVRHWPRMNRKDLMALFPDGKTIHVPSDGKPLDGYNQALAAYNARKGAPPAIIVAEKEKAKGKDKAEKKPLFAGLFGKKKPKPEKPAKTPPATVVAAAPPQVAEAAAVPEEPRIILPEDNVPIPVFSPVKPGQEMEDEEQEDEIGALLVADATMNSPAREIVEPPTTLPGLSEMAFVPIPALKASPPALLTQRQEPAALPPVQRAHLPVLTRPTSEQAEEPKPDDALTQIIAQSENLAQDLAENIEEESTPMQVAILPPSEQITESAVKDDGRQDLASLRQQPLAQDLSAFDSDTIRTIIADAMAIAEADSQMVASITPRTAPKADKPSLDELGALIAQDEAQRLSDAANMPEEVRQIPELVFVSGLQKGKKQPTIATLDGKAINFPPVARIAISD